MLLLSGEMCCFLHFMQWRLGLDFFGVMWGNVIGPLRSRGLGLLFRFSYLILVLLYFLCLFWLCINFGIGGAFVSFIRALAFP